jgi:hypothetical protein
MTALTRQLYDRVLAAPSCGFDGASPPSSAGPTASPVTGRGGNAGDVKVWLAATASTVEAQGFTAAGDFAVLPQLHDAELNGSVTWWKPDDGFSVQRTDGFVIAPIAGAGVFLNGGLLIRSIPRCRGNAELARAGTTSEAIRDRRDDNQLGVIALLIAFGIWAVLRFGGSLHV